MVPTNSLGVERREITLLPYIIKAFAFVEGGIITGLGGIPGRRDRSEEVTAEGSE